MIKELKQDNLEEWLDFIQKELQRAAVDKKHPFRFVVLSSGSAQVSSRYVVLRKVNQLNQLLIYTDTRSNKVAEIKQNDQVQLLFYNQQKGLQLMISCRVVLHHRDDELAKQEWNHVQGNARKSYCTTAAPGSPIVSPDDALSWDQEFTNQYFTVIEALPQSIEFLELGRGKHLRAKYQKSTGWTGQWLVP